MCPTNMRVDRNRIFKPGQPAEFVSAEVGYDRWAGCYDNEANPLIALEEPRIPLLLGDINGLEILEVGCGTGRHTLRLAAAGARVTATDLSTGMVAQASEKPGWNNVRFLRHDFNQPLPFADCSFDCVCTFLTLEHVHDLCLFFSECRRVCRSGGFVVASAMHPAMMLRGIQAHFRDSTTGADVCPQSVPHQLCDFVMGILHARLQLVHLSEHFVDDELASRSPRAAKYHRWPMLVLLRATRPH